MTVLNDEYELRVRTPDDLEGDLRILAGIADQDDKFESSRIMQAKNWAHPDSTPHAILKTLRFQTPHSRLWTVHHQGQPVCISGVYPHSPGIGIVGARTYIVPEHRTKSLMGELVFPEQQEFCTGRFDFMIMTFALNNLWLPRMILRAASGRTLQFGKKNADFYYGWNEFSEPIEIKNVPQKVLWKPLKGGNLVPEYLNTPI